jgi:hypothetical protein
MGGLWLGSIVVYGSGVAKIGVLGPVVGWPVFMSGAVIASAAWGTVFGEWKNSGTTAKAAMTSGVFCLIVAIFFWAKRLLNGFPLLIYEPGIGYHSLRAAR